MTCNLHSLLAGQSEGLCCAIRQWGWFRAETARVIRSVAHSFVYIQRLDIKLVYTAVDRNQHPYSAQEAARDKQTRIAVERSSLVFSGVQADSRALGHLLVQLAIHTLVGWSVGWLVPWVQIRQLESAGGVLCSHTVMGLRGPW